jgi:hypothetical protein
MSFLIVLFQDDVELVNQMRTLLNKIKQITNDGVKIDQQLFKQLYQEYGIPN